MQNSTLITVKVACSAFAAIAASCNQPIKYPEGGYDYPSHGEVKDTAFYYLPIEDSFSRKDSFFRATAFFYFQYLKEPNMSIKPFDKDIFRFIYSSTVGGSYIIILTQKEIIVKSPDASYFDYVYGNGNLTKTEEYLLRQLELRHPLYPGKYKKGSHLAKQTDSLIKLYPKLTDVNYYWYLVNKKFGPTKNLKFFDTTIRINYWDFKHLVSTINASGYWKMPYRIRCDDPPTDGYGFSLEANTAKKYNYVELGSCTDNTPMQVAFEKACQELVHYAKLDKEISLVSDWKMDSVHIDSARWKHL